jgi:hypothetical protein
MQHALRLNGRTDALCHRRQHRRRRCLQITFIHFNVYGSVHCSNILIYIQQDATLYSLFYLETAVHVSGGTSNHHQERKQLYLQHLVFFTRLLLPTTHSNQFQLFHDSGR